MKKKILKKSIKTKKIASFSLNGETCHISIFWSSLKVTTYKLGRIMNKSQRHKEAIFFVLIDFFKICFKKNHNSPLGTDHLTCRGGGYGFFSLRNFLSEYFLLLREARNFFQNLTLGYMTKPLKIF
jgi:hypothetical protein